MITRLAEYLKHKNISTRSFEMTIGASDGMIRKAINTNKDIQSKWLYNISENYPDLNLQWLITGKGKMLKSELPQINSSGNLIPFYDDVITVGGMNSISAAVDGHMPASEFIDAGDWFRDATAAIRHYGESMQEYPSGCILALKKINNKGMIVWGKNYCIETGDFRITKRLQHGDDHDTYVMAYSTNRETYPDGRLIHEPVKIPTDEINNLFLVLGCVIKEQSSGAVYIKQ